MPTKSDSNIEDFGKKNTNLPFKPEPSTEKQKSEDSVDTTEEEKHLVYHYKQWGEISSNLFRGISHVEKKLPAGLYNVYKVHDEVYFDKKTINVDEYINFKDSIGDEVLNEIENFWKLYDKFKNHGFLHRRGYMLYGPQGSGKTILVQQIIERIIKNKGLAIDANCSPSVLVTGLDVLRKIEPNRNIVVIFEDIDAYITSWGEDRILKLLDGEGQIDKVINIATTNYPEKLDKRIIKRPRRFDRLIKFGMPSESIRREYFKHKLPNLEKIELERWVKETNGFSFAALSDLIIGTQCFNNSFEYCIDNLKYLFKSKPSSEEFELIEMGFHNNGHK